MDNNLESLFDDIMQSPNTVGSLLANKQGLCIEARGKASPQSAGILVALSEQASKLDQNCNPPTVVLDYDNMSCFIHKYGITGAVYKRKDGGT